MAAMLVTYDISDKDSRDWMRDQIKDVIANGDNKKWRELSESCYVVETELSLKDVYAFLFAKPNLPHTGKYRFFVIPITVLAEGWGDEATKNWLAEIVCRASRPKA